MSHAGYVPTCKIEGYAADPDTAQRDVLIKSLDLPKHPEDTGDNYINTFLTHKVNGRDFSVTVLWPEVLGEGDRRRRDPIELSIEWW